MKIDGHKSHYSTVQRWRNTAELSRSRIIVELDQSQPKKRLTNIYQLRLAGNGEWITSHQLSQTSSLSEWLYLDEQGTPSLYWNAECNGIVIL